MRQIKEDAYALRTMFAMLLAFLLLTFAITVDAQAPSKPDLIEVIEITGEIHNGAVLSVAQAVEKINDTPKVKGVLVVVNSPGGGALASAVLYQELSKLKVPAVGFCEYLCASGGLYALMAPSIKYIAVRSETISGSVGVIATVTRYNRLLDWAKIDSETYKSGPLKDAGNPTRAAQDEERKYMQGIVDDLAAKFHGIVSKARPKADMAVLKTARVFIGDQAVKVGLVDSVMTRDEAVKKVKELAGTKNAFTREELRKITKDASEAAGSTLTTPQPRMDGWLDNANYLVDVVREIKSGESIRFEYRMPYRF